uniref:Cullin domain-containing protein n=1 Tax=Trichobilharzia regenti TaxID=157069 RepID=A0AA85IXA1_TRIRE|nr:unnamed protein product [Trichobilharzia regenti]
MVKKNCLILAFVWTLFQFSYVLCNEISSAKSTELNSLIKRYSDLFGRYKSAECAAFLVVSSPEIKWTLKEFNDVIRDTKLQIFANTSVDYLNKLKSEYTWKNVNEVSYLYHDYIGQLKDVEEYHNNTVFEKVWTKMGNMKVTVNLHAVFENYLKSLGNAWTARKDLYTTADEPITAEEWGEIIEREFIKSREKFEQECLRISRIQPNETSNEILLKKSDGKNLPISELQYDLVQLMSEVEKVEKLRIERFHTLTALDIMNIALDTMQRERDHEFGEQYVRNTEDMERS